MTNIIRSISQCQNEILENIKQLYCPEGFECDVTYGKGNFYKNTSKPKHCFDIDPLCDNVVKSDSRLLPLPNASVASVIFDPPFLTYIRNAKKGNGSMALAKQYGGFWSYEELEDYYRDTISEVYRIIQKRGVFVVKCQDIIHNHKMQSTHTNVINMADIEGFRLKDNFILLANKRMPSPQKGKQRHARIFHSHFLVFERSVN
tara:strand:- start:1048 stop:1656 length:609 start_codon:yes stop_codon:yes gene_type:complete